MNVFQLAGDLSHLLAIIILLLKIWKTRSCAGISGRSQILFALTYTTRYLDLFSNFISIYNSVMKIFFIGASCATLYLMYLKFKATYDRNHDTFRIEFLVIPVVILSLVVNHDFSPLEILWTFSIYLESVAILPQLFMVSKTGEAETITSHYLFCLGSYRGLYILNWVYRYYSEGFYDLIRIIAGIVQTVLYCGFFYLYITKDDLDKGDSRDYKIVCYYSNWAVYRPGLAKFSPENIISYLCTHIIYAFASLSEGFQIQPFDPYNDMEQGNYRSFVSLKSYNPSLKTMIAVGGWNEGSRRFSRLVESPDNRRTFVSSVLAFLREQGFDGIDLDWEYPAFREGGNHTTDKGGYAMLVKELRQAIDEEKFSPEKERLILSVAVPATKEYIDQGFDVPEISKHAHFLNLLTYDYHSAYEPETHHHAPLYPPAGLDPKDDRNQLNVGISAARLGFNAFGVKLNPWLVMYSKAKAFYLGLNKKAAFKRQDIWKTDLNKYENIVIFGVEQMMPQLEEKLHQELKDDACVIACRFPLPGWKESATAGKGIDTVWLYEKRPLSHH